MRQGQIRRHVGTAAAFAQLAAGIAIFLFGMRFMKDGFSAFTGGTLETLLKRFTKGPWRSLGFGIVATTLTQSSGLVSVITISFLSAGLIDLAAGIGLVFGANLGTTSGAGLIATLGLGSGPIKLLPGRSAADSLTGGRTPSMSDLFWLSERQLAKIEPHFPLSHGVPRVDDRRVISGIVHMIRNGLRWRDAPLVYGPHKTLYNRFVRWRRLGVFSRIFAALTGEAGPPDRLMIDATHLKAHRAAARSPPDWPDTASWPACRQHGSNPGVCFSWRRVRTTPIPKPSAPQSRPGWRRPGVPSP